MKAGMSAVSFMLLLLAVSQQLDAAAAFSVTPMCRSAHRQIGTLEESSSSSDNNDTNRRHFVGRVTAAASAAMLGLQQGLLQQPVVSWAVTGTKKVNAKLQGYGLPALPPVPNNMTPLLEIYGKGANRFPLLVTFAFPGSWVLTLPSNTVNGEDGTIQAGDYAKGDTATLFVWTDKGRVDNIQAQGKELFEKALQQSIGQKGENQYQNFKVTKLTPHPDAADYMLADFRYQLLTGAGFEVDRRGVASITSQGPAVEVLWTASTAIRWKKMEATLRDIVPTFRVYADGLGLSDEIKDVETFQYKGVS